MGRSGLEDQGGGWGIHEPLFPGKAEEDHPVQLDLLRFPQGALHPGLDLPLERGLGLSQEASLLQGQAGGRGAVAGHQVEDAARLTLEEDGQATFLGKGQAQV